LPAGAPPQTPLGSLQLSPDPLVGFVDVGRREYGRGSRGKAGEGKGGMEWTYPTKFGRKSTPLHGTAVGLRAS